nr:MAG TPA: hypothetical protein [Caudoviricetes sp.]
MTRPLITGQWSTWRSFPSGSASRKPSAPAVAGH